LQHLLLAHVRAVNFYSAHRYMNNDASLHLVQLVKLTRGSAVADTDDVALYVTVSAVNKDQVLSISLT